MIPTAHHTCRNYNPQRTAMKRIVRTALRRSLSTSSRHGGKYNEPLSGNDMPRSGGIASMMRLPVQTDSQGKNAHLFQFISCIGHVPICVTYRAPSPRYNGSDKTACADHDPTYNLSLFVNNHQVMSYNL